MRDYLNDKVAQKNQEEEKKKRKIRFDPDEEEETYMYDIKKPAAFINEGEHGVFDITKQTGINTAKNVFDRGATFKTS